MAVLNPAAAGTTTSLHSSFKGNPRFLLPLTKRAVAALLALSNSRTRCKTDTPAKGCFIPAEHRWMYEGIEKLGPAYPRVLVMLTQALQAVLRVSTRVLTEPLPLYRGTSNRCNQCNTGRLNYNYERLSARFFSSSDSSDPSDTEAGDLHSRDEPEISDVDELSEDDTSDTIYSDQEIFEAFQSELTLDDDDEEKEAKVSQRGTHPARLSLEEPHKDEQGKKPWNRKERVKACLDKLQRGPDGRYINVLEVATEVDMLIASYLKLRYQDDPALAENSDEDEKLLEGIDIEKFKRLSKRLRDGTYEFQPIVQVPLPRKRIVKRKKKKLKKKHAF